MALQSRQLMLMTGQLQKQFLSLRQYRVIRIVDILTSRPLDSTVSVKGWVKTVRKMKDNIFADINDGSCPDRLQVVIPKGLKPNYLSFGASVEIEGRVEENVKRHLEVKASKVIVTGPCDVSDGYPFVGKATQPIEYMRKFLHLRSRTSVFSSTLRVRDAATKAVHDYFSREGYLYIHTPILTSNDCEGAGEIFMVRPANESLLKEMKKHGTPLDEAYFDTKTFLTVSGQFHLEAIARGLGNVFSFGPTFRAENSRSRLHLSEFYMVEAEAAFMSDLNELLKMMENFLKEVVSKILDRCESDVSLLQDDESRQCTTNLIQKPFSVLSFSEALSLLNQHFEGPKPIENEGLSKEHELFLVNYMGKVPVFVVEWPAILKPFYMKQMPNSSKVAAVDLLAPSVGELCGGSMREDNIQLLKHKLASIGQLDSLQWYLDLRKFGNVPTAGFGMGFERFLQVLLGVGNIKDTIPFPRWPHNCSL